MLPASETVIWLIRHGRSTFNAQGRCQGCCDLPKLTEVGRQEGRGTGARLRRTGIEALISSPLRRATQTASEIKDELGKEIPVEIDARLREIELPQWEGLALAEIPRRFPEQFLDWQLRPSRLSMPSPCGAQTFPVRGLYQRAREFWRDILAAYSGRSVALVTHGGTGRALITTALGLGPQHFHSIQQSNCAISRLHFSPGAQQAQLALLNDTAHLGERLPKLKEGNTGTRLLLIPAADEDAIARRHIAAPLERVSIDAVFVAGTTDARTTSLIPPNLKGRIQQIPEGSLQYFAQAAVHNRKSCSLLHVVFVAPAPCLRRLLRQQFNLDASVAERMILAGPAMTAVHHPNGNPPVLQALNMFEPEFSFIGVPV